MSKTQIADFIIQNVLKISNFEKKAQKRAKTLKKQKKTFIFFVYAFHLFWGVAFNLSILCAKRCKNR